MKLRKPELRQLRQRISLWCRTQPLDEEQTRAYILARLQTAGTGEAIFQEDAIRMIYEASGGIPRIINLICENSLIFAYVDQSAQITTNHVNLVLQDLKLGLADELLPRRYVAP